MSTITYKIGDPCVCRLCGSHFPDETEPDFCPICKDDRGLGFTPEGQPFSNLGTLRRSHHTINREEEPGLIGIGVEPRISANHRALLVCTDEGNVLWDCVPIIDDAAIGLVQELGGLTAIAVSHPHFYGAMVEWSRAFGGTPVYIHAADRGWVTYPDSAIIYWQGEQHELPGGLTLINCGGHFDGATVLHWPAGAEGNGVLLTGDPISVTPNRQVTFMYAYGNLIPLSARSVTRVVNSVEPFVFDRIYGGFFNARVDCDAKAVVERSAQRYLRALEA